MGFFLSARLGNIKARELLITVSLLSLDFNWWEKKETVQLFRNISNVTSGLAAVKMTSNI